jgi:hypothetical protein
MYGNVCVRGRGRGTTFIERKPSLLRQRRGCDVENQ